MTSTERRIRFSPEIPGPRIGEARSEWEVMAELAQRILPEPKAKGLSFQSADAIREEMDRVIPMYRGIKDVRKEKDSFQYGGTRLLEGGICSNLPEGRARFSVATPQNELLKPGEFYLTTRRGKQFNSIVYGTADPLTGSKRRDEVYLSMEDAQRLSLKEGDPVTLKSDTGEFRGVCKIAQVRPGTVQTFWPEANVLLSRRIDPQSMEPDYNCIVRIV